MGSTPYLIGVDAGTSNCKATLIECGGRVVTSAQHAYPTHHPRAGWAEQDPNDWYRAVAHVVRQCINAADVDPGKILAVSVCGPAHNAVLLDREGHALQSVILWSDLRSSRQARWLEAQHGSLIFETTYHPPNPSWTLSQLLWVRENQPEIWRHIDRIVIGKDYLSYRLTGSWRTDWYDAMGTQMFDARSRVWSEPICQIIGLPLEWLPPISDAHEITGRVSAAGARETGLVQGTPLAVGSGDSVIEAMGASVVRPGQCIVKLGTAGNVNAVAAKPRPDRRTLTYSHVVPGQWFTVVPTNSGAAAAAWFREAFSLGAASTEQKGSLVVDDLAAEVAPGSEGLIFHPYLQGERAPHWDPNLRGGFVGVTVRHRQSHFARAVLEGIAFSLRDCLGLVRELNLPIAECYLLGGGARSALWRQILADVLDTELKVFSTETTSHGAALMAGVAAGVYVDVLDAARHAVRAVATVKPDPANAALYERLYVLYRQVAQSLAPLYQTWNDYED